MTQKTEKKIPLYLKVEQLDLLHDVIGFKRDHYRGVLNELEGDGVAQNAVRVMDDKVHTIDEEICSTRTEAEQDAEFEIQNQQPEPKMEDDGE